MFFGTYKHTIDDNGRLTVPARLRESVISEILDGTKNGSISREQAREFKRIFGGEGAMQPWDKQGRILLPDNLKDYAGITREVNIVGALDCIEIWDAQAYVTRLDSAKAAYDDIAGKIIP